MRQLRFYSLLSLLACGLIAVPVTGHMGAQMASAPAETAQHQSTGILGAADAGKLMPETVFFQDKTAPVQARNSAGVRFGPQALFLAALVDASGYSSQVQERYQAYLIAESPMLIGDHPLPAGAYGCGFVKEGTFLVMDIGGHTLFTVPSGRDSAMRRPTPLQIVAGSTPGEYRLYGGRSYVAFRAGAGAPQP